MTQHVHQGSGERPDGKRWRRHRLAAAAGLLLAAASLSLAPFAFSAQAPVGLGTAANFAVIAGSTVTNTGPSVISGSIGLSPGTSVIGFPPGIVLAGTTQIANGVALQAQSDLVTAYNSAAGASSTATVSGDLAGRTLVSGVYTSASSLGLTGALTLDAQGNPNAVFIFQAGSTLIVGSGSQVNLINGAQACNVFWQVGSSATIGTGAAFVGNIMALTSVTMTTGATLQGRALARNGAVTLDTNTITSAACAAPTTTGGGSTTTGSGTTTTGGGSTTTGNGSSPTTTKPGTKGSTGASGAAGTKKPTVKKHKPTKPKPKKPTVEKHKPTKPIPKPITPKPVIPTAAKPPAFTG
jgi:Ice-binding-like